MPELLHSSAPTRATAARSGRSVLRAAAGAYDVNPQGAAGAYVNELCGGIFLAAIERDGLRHVRSAEIERQHETLGDLERLGRVELSWRTDGGEDAVVSLPGGELVLLVGWEGACEIVVAGREPASVSRACDALARALRQSAPRGDELMVRFWADGRGHERAHARRRRLDAPEWAAGDGALVTSCPAVVFYEPHLRDRTLLPHDPFKAAVAPRPIGWVSTLSADGAVNLAPYSFFNAVCGAPPMIAFSSEGMKDSAAFAIETREFVWNMPTWDLREAMNATSASLTRGENEFDHAGLEMAPSRMVAPPRVAASPCALECKVTNTLNLSDVHGNDTDRHLVVGQVVGVHLDERYITDDGILDVAAMRPIARCGYTADYAVLDRLFQMERPR